MDDNLQCDKCGSIFTDKSKLRKHFDKHRNLKCNVCGRTYLSLNNLKHHLKIHFDKSYFIICDICGRSINKYKLKRHIERHDPNSRASQNNQNVTYSCRFCGLIFNKINNRTSHEKRIHKSKSDLGLENFKCMDCSSVFLTKEQLRNHSFLHYGKKIHYCDYPGCNRFFKKGKLLTVHKRCHFEPQFKCLDCGSLFVQKAGLHKHQKGRCPMKKKAVDVQTKDDLEKLAIVAKEQFIELKGRIAKTSNSDKNNRDTKKPNKTSSNELENVDIKNERIDMTPEDWQYEFLDEAMLELNKVESGHIFADRLSPKKDPECEGIKNENVLKTECVKLKEPKTVVKKTNYVKPRRKNDFICDLCGLSNLKTKTDLQKHVLTHRKEVTHRNAILYPCDEKDCKEAFSSKSLLTQHKRGFHCIKVIEKRHSDPFICDYCGKKYWARSSIVTHLLVTHKTIADFKCDKCCRKFKSHGNLIRHLRAVHSEGKQFGCEKCGAMFKEKYQLEVHVHNHDEPTQCNLCGKMVSNIKVHLRHHASKSNNTIVKCPMCDKMIGKYQLIRHIKAVHEKQYQSDSNKLNLKVYTCKDCGDFFSRRQELRQHEYINHSQSKIYECNICGNFFKKLKLLNVHRFSHQPLNIACEICNNVYARKGALWKHQKKHHPELLLKKQN